MKVLIMRQVISYILLQAYQSDAILDRQEKESVMVTKKYFTTGLVLLCLSYATFADDVELTPQYSVCMDKSEGITAVMVDCITEETKRQDARLNKAYKEVMAELSPARQKQLQDAQRVWIKYRDANCNFYADPNGGSLARVNANDCFMSATAARAKELEDFKVTNNF
jgi:uncharacterized protein YecT (DUF1311 family)